MKKTPVCSVHFAPAAFQRNLKYELLQMEVPSSLIKFKSGAVPTLHLPSSQVSNVHLL